MLPFSPELALIAVPIAVYLYALGLFHGGRHPRVVSGTADLAWLLASLSGLVAFGPIGKGVVLGVFGADATPLAWSAWLAILFGAAWLLARTGRNRVVIYHVAADQVRTVLGPLLGAVGDAFRPTLQGFEDGSGGVSILVRTYPKTRTAVVEVQGANARTVAGRIQSGLRAALLGVEPPASVLATAFFAASGLIMLVPVVGYLLHGPAR